MRCGHHRQFHLPDFKLLPCATPGCREGVPGSHLRMVKRARPAWCQTGPINVTEKVQDFRRIRHDPSLWRWIPEEEPIELEEVGKGQDC